MPMNKEEPPTPSSKEEKIKDLLLKEANYTSVKNSKRLDYLSWDEYFMSVALLSAQRSKDPSCQVGACIINQDKRIIGIGYNGFPRGCSDKYLPWCSNTSTTTPEIQTKSLFTCPAEINAILNKCSADVVGATIYVTHFPNNECAKVIIQSGIKQVIYLHDLHSEDDMYRASRILFGLADVSFCSYASIIGDAVVKKRIVLDWGQFIDNLNEEKKEAMVSSDKDEEPITEEIKKLLLEEAGINADDATILNTHRKNYLTWDDYFLAIALLSAQRSKDPNTQVGACIVNTQNRIVGIGYNGFPRNCGDDILPWSRQSSSSTLHTKYPYVCHAEMNAILNKCSHDIENSKIYVALFPCNDCAKVIIQSGIKEVIYLSNKYRDTDSCRASRIMFGMAGVTLRQYAPNGSRNQTFLIDFQDCNE